MSVVPVLMAMLLGCSWCPWVPVDLCMSVVLVHCACHVVHIISCACPFMSNVHVHCACRVGPQYWTLDLAFLSYVWL